MFFILRKICIGIGILILAGVLYYLYLKREMFQPALAMVEVWRNENVHQQRIIGTATGKAIQVVSGNSFWVRLPNGQRFILRLTGIDVPSLPPKPEPAVKELILESEELLSDLVLSNEVTWQITVANGQTDASGVVFVGTTNVNLMMLRSGLAKLHLPGVAGLPRREQYRLYQAQHAARKEEKGWWEGGNDEMTNDEMTNDK